MYIFKVATSLLLVLGLGLALAGCGPMYNTSYQYIPPKAFRGRQCVNQCLEDKTSCRMQSRAEHAYCVKQARRAARPAFRAYVRQQRRLKKPITRDINDFADTYQCRSSAGECESTFRMCYQNCGGRVITHKRCVAFCGKK